MSLNRILTFSTILPRWSHFLQEIWRPSGWAKDFCSIGRSSFNNFNLYFGKKEGVSELASIHPRSSLLQLFLLLRALRCRHQNFLVPPFLDVDAGVCHLMWSKHPRRVGPWLASKR
jgi:hypothetical protein